MVWFPGIKDWGQALVALFAIVVCSQFLVSATTRPINPVDFHSNAATETVSVITDTVKTRVTNGNGSGDSTTVKSHTVHAWKR